MASRGRHGSMNFVAMRRVRRCGLRVAFVAHTQEFRCSAVRTPLWATPCLRRIRTPKNFVSLAVRAPLWAAHCRDCSPCTETFVALQCARCCGLRVVFVASDRPSILFPLRRARRCGLRVVFIASDNPSISFALPCCIRLPKTFVALQCMIFFSIGLLVSYGFMFFL